MSRRKVKDERVREYLLAERILWQSSDDAVTNSQTLLDNNTGQVLLGKSNVCRLRSGDSPGSILLDFGKELHGGIQIVVGDTKDQQPVRLRIRLGESAGEAMAELGGEKNATNDHAIRDQVVSAPRLGVLETNLSGFRFVRIDLIDEHRFVELQAVRAVFVYRDLEYKGSFECSDELLNRIWQTGAYTVHLNMQEYLWDGIKRDRLVWIGDMHPETMTICAVFGEQGVVPKSLDFVRDATPLPAWMNAISSYSLWWVLIQRDWYRFHGDETYLQEQTDYLHGLTQMLIDCVGDDGKEMLPEWRFLDWPTQGNDRAKHAGLQALLKMSLEACRELWGILNDSTETSQCEEGLQKLRDYVPDPGAKAAAALMVLAGLVDAEEANREILIAEGVKGISSFYGYYVLQARAKAGDYQGCLDVIREYWGGMLSMGATTFWEDFDVAWMEDACPIDRIPQPGERDIHGDFGAHCYKGFRHSLCHGWASGPTAWLSEHVLGVKVLEPGCRTIAIEPHLGDLEWAKGTFPAPQGVICVSHRKVNGRIETQVQVPDGIEIVNYEEE